MPAFLPEARGKVVSLPFPASGEPPSSLVTKSQVPGTGMWVSLGHPSAHRTGRLVELKGGGGGGHGDCSRQGTLTSDLISFPSKPGVQGLRDRLKSVIQRSFLQNHTARCAFHQTLTRLSYTQRPV